MAILPMQHYVNLMKRNGLFIAVIPAFLLLVGCGSDGRGAGANTPTQWANFSSSAGTSVQPTDIARSSSSLGGPSNAAGATSSAGSGAVSFSKAASSSVALNASAVDDQAPSAPSRVVSTLVSHKSVHFSWNKSSDNVGVYRYFITRNKDDMGFVSASETTYSDSGLQPNTQYTYSVVAQDLAGNRSAEAFVQVKTYSVNGDVNLEWQEPAVRVNGEPLNASDIAGYIVRYKLASASQFTEVPIEGAVTQYKLPQLSGNYIMEIATMDLNGLVSDFVPVEFY